MFREITIYDKQIKNINNMLCIILYIRNMKLFVVILFINYVNLFVFGSTEFIEKLGQDIMKTEINPPDIKFQILHKLDSRISNKQLRGMYKEEFERTKLQLFVNEFNILYDQIIITAKQGINEHNFTIMCSQYTLNRNNDCLPNNGNLHWSRYFPNNIMVTTTIIEKYATDMIDALHTTFPDSNITKTYKNCCDYYTIEW